MHTFNRCDLGCFRHSSRMKTPLMKVDSSKTIKIKESCEHNLLILMHLMESAQIKDNDSAAGKRERARLFI